MKLVKKASGKTTVKMSKSEWTDLGKKAGWLKKAEESDSNDKDITWQIIKNVTEAMEELWTTANEIERNVENKNINGQEAYRNADLVVKKAISLINDFRNNLETEVLQNIWEKYFAGGKSSMEEELNTQLEMMKTDPKAIHWIQQNLKQMTYSPTHYFQRSYRL